jgi:D-amino-acid dehydrogenase
VRVVVVGAGMVGLSTAWFLQERGVEVTVAESRHVAAGASWGNAGWLTPAFAGPLPEPGMLRTGLRSLFSADSPLYIPPRPDVRLARFLVALARNCTRRKWQVSMSALAGLNDRAFAAYDAMAAGGVGEPTTKSDRFLIVCGSDAQRRGIVSEFGPDASYDLVTGEQAQSIEPALTDAVGPSVLLHGQRYLNPGDFVAALATSVEQRGGRIVSGAAVTGVRDLGRSVRLSTATGDEFSCDATVLATGAWLPRLAGPFGVRMPVQAGRGYSFTVASGILPTGPTYFPARKTVCTPLGEGRVRVSGMMEFTSPDRPLDPRRITAVIAATRPMLRDVDWDGRTDDWVGSRPCTTDGLPLAGPTRSPRVFVAGGHAMWGIALGPVTGELMAEAITGHPPVELAALHPLR